jgi:hypothetical protein
LSTRKPLKVLLMPCTSSKGSRLMAELLVLLFLWLSEPDSNPDTFSYAALA